MGKISRKKNSTVYGCYEGDREELILELFNGLYEPKINHINITLKHAFGGSPDRIVGLALKNNDRDKVFAFFDEDFEPNNPLSEEIKEELARCWCIHPDQMESFFICPLGKLQSSYNQKKRKPVL